MRGRKKQQQNIYVVDYTEIDIVDEHGDKTGDKEKVYVLRKTFKASVSETATLPSEINIGAVEDYERYFTCTIDPKLKVGDYVFIDEEPTISEGTITNNPDYVIQRPIKTQKNIVFRYGIKKCV